MRRFSSASQLLEASSVSASGSIGELQCPLSDSQTHLSDESYHGLDESDGGGLPLVETYPCPSWTTAAPPPSSPSPAAPPSPPMASTASADDVRDATGFQPSFTHPDAAEAGRGESASHVNVELSTCVRAIIFEQGGRTARNYCKPKPCGCRSILRLAADQFHTGLVRSTSQPGAVAQFGSAWPVTGLVRV